MTKLEIFRREAPLGARVTLRLTRGDDVSGRVDALDDGCIRLHTGQSTVTVFENLLAGWEVHHGGPAGGLARSASHATPQNDPDNARALPVAPPSPAQGEALQLFTRIKAEFSTAVARARLEPPKPDFRFPETEFPSRRVPDERRNWDQARNQYDYALKVNEISRLNSIVVQILLPLQARHPGSAATNALLGHVLLKLNRQSDAIKHMSAAAALSDKPTHWLSLAAAAQENTALQCYALRRYFRVAPPAPAEDSWFRYLAAAIEHCDLRRVAQVIRHWHGQPATGPHLCRLLSESVVYLLSRRNAAALAVTTAAALVRQPLELPSDWEEQISDGTSPSAELLAAERRFVRPSGPAPAPTAPVRASTPDDAPLTGRIVSFGNKRFGFIDADSGASHYFRIDDVADERLHDALLDGSWGTFAAVEFEPRPSYGHKYDRATEILPQDSESRLRRAQHLRAIGRLPQALGLVRRVLAADPGDEAAGRVEQEVKEAIRMGLGDGTGLPKGDGPYARAKRAQLVDLDLGKAEKLLRQAIDGGDRPESAVKDLASLLNQQTRVDEAIALLEDNSSRTDGVSPFDNMLATLYEHAQRHDDAIRVLNRLHGTASGPRLNALLARMAFSHLRCSRYDDAERLLRELLAVEPNDRTALKLMSALDDARHAESSDEAEEIIGGLGMLVDEGVQLSWLASTAIEGCTYDGVDPTRVQTGTAGQRDVTRVVNLAKTLGTKRPRDRAAYYLSAAALLDRKVRDREPGRIHDYLRGYFASMADAAWTDKRPADVVRAYYIESLALVDNDSGHEAWRTMIRYLATFSPSRLRDAEATLPREYRRRTRPRYIDALQKTLQIVDPEPADDWWEGLVAVGSQSSFAKDGLCEAFITHPTLRSTFEGLLDRSSHEVYAIEEAWDARCRERARTHRRRLSICRTLTRCHATVASMAQLDERLRNAIAETHTRVDARRLNTLADIVEPALAFCRASDFEEREHNYGLVTTRAEELRRELIEEPTQYSCEGLLPIADHVRSLIEEEYAQMDRTSGAKLGLRLLVDKYLRGRRGELRLQIEVSNEPGCSPASSVRVRLGPEDSEYFGTERWEREVVSNLRGGHKEIAQIDIRPKDIAVQARAFPLSAMAVYQNRLGEERRTADHGWTVRLYGDSEFQHLENPYAPYAEGGPVDDPAMFVGRDDLLSRLESSLVSGSGSKSVVIFGQKRAGKSSLIEHLRRSLVQRDDVLPVCFSLQDIATELSVPALYHRILHGVSEALDDLRRDGKDTPGFSLPEIQALESHPGLRFHDSMSSVVRAMKTQTHGRRIVLLIDEFTDIFKAIRRKHIPREFMKAWKAIIEKRYFSSVLVGQDIMPAFKREFPNEFGVTEDVRVTYLADAAATSLVQRPIGEERFAGDAVRRLLDLTGNSPYYTMMFCARLVDYMNRTRSVVVTEADVRRVEQEMVRGDRRLTLDKFDNLLTAGDGVQDSGIDPDGTYAVCAVIARASGEGWCPRESVNGEFDGVHRDALLTDLEARDVVDRKGTGYRLRVGLFRDWLLLQG